MTATPFAKSPTPAVWRQAKNILSQQPSLRSELSTIFASSPSSGLYADENVKSFPSFVRYVQASLALSPKTILRHAVDNSFDRLWKENPKLFGELYEILGLVAENKNNIVMLSETMSRLSKGQLYSKLRNVTLASKKQSPYYKDPDGFRKRLSEGLRSKNGSNGEPSSEEIDSAIDTILEKDKKRQRKASDMAKELEAQLLTDKEFIAFERAQELWVITGAEKLWGDYNKVVQIEGRERRLRGGNFEKDSSALCFATIVSIIQPSSDYPVSSYTYVQNAHWCDGESSPTGEIDLVVMCNGEAVAICEMKAGCFEIAAAIAQHETKLKNALARDDANDENKPRIQLKTSQKSIVIPFAISGEREEFALPLFILTRLPKGPILGAEPALSHAICEGIRDQGLNIRDNSTASVLRTVSLSEFLDLGVSRTIAQKNLIEKTDQNDYDASQNIDMVVLEEYVRNEMGQARLRESPKACLHQYGANILVFPRTLNDT